MKIQIRKLVFETNSSSVHTMVMCDKEDYNDWEDGKMLFLPDLDTFLNTEEANKYNKSVLEDNMIYEKDYKDHDAYMEEIWRLKMEGSMYLTFDEYFDSYTSDYHTYCDSYNGVTTFGYYGNNY